jgi:hypothetical protein
MEKENYMNSYKARAARVARYMAYLNGRGPQYKVAESVSFRGTWRPPIMTPALVEEPPMSPIGNGTKRLLAAIKEFEAENIARDFVLLRGRCTRANIA